MSRFSFRPRVEPLEGRWVPSFNPPAGYPAGVAPHALSAADFDGNGTTDLAALDADTLRVLSGNGDGTFAAAQTSPAGPAPDLLAVADFDADGRPDAVVSNPGFWQTSLAFLRGNGDGTFQPRRAFATSGDTPVALEVGDLNSDGRPDLVVTSYTRFYDNEGYYTQWNFLEVLVGRGDGSFQTGTGVYLGEDYDIPTLALGDVTGDGRVDVATAGTYVGLGVWPGNGDGTLQPPRYAGAASGGPLVLADLNRDGKLDVVNGPYSRLGNGDGSFGPQRSYASGVYLYSVTSVAVADFNRDGIPDLAAASPGYGDPDSGATNGNALAVFPGNGDGTFGTGQPHAAGSRPAGVGAADFNADGFPDLAATAAPPGGPVSVLLNDRAWTAPRPTISIDDVAVVEGNAGTTAAVFTVRLSSAYDRPVTVNFATTAGTATAGSDYRATAGTLTFAPGERTKTVVVLVNGDRLAEPEFEEFTVRLSSPTNATVSDSDGSGRIRDDEPHLRIGDVLKREGQKGQTTLFTFAVTLSAAYDQPVTVSFRTVNGSATTGDGDYASKSGTLTFAPGETTKTITIEVKGDRKRESDEYFYLDLFNNSSNSWFAQSRATGWILNDD